MPYPSAITYPSAATFPGLPAAPVLAAVGLVEISDTATAGAESTSLFEGVEVRSVPASLVDVI
jgi:hypothetical protein